MSNEVKYLSREHVFSPIEGIIFCYSTLMLQNRCTSAAKNIKIYTHVSCTHTHNFVCLTFCHRSVFVHRQQFLNCSVQKGLLLLCYSTVFCLRKQSLIFETRQHVVSGWKSPWFLSAPLVVSRLRCFCRGWRDPAAGRCGETPLRLFWAVDLGC